MKELTTRFAFSFLRFTLVLEWYTLPSSLLYSILWIYTSRISMYVIISLYNRPCIFLLESPSLPLQSIHYNVNEKGTTLVKIR